MNFLKMVYKPAGWDNDGTYRISGILYLKNRLVEFEFVDTAKITDEEFADPEVDGKE